MMKTPAIVYLTAASREDARRLARELVAAKLAACVNYWQNAASVYMWEGKLCEEQETVLLIKTFAEKFTAIQEFMGTQHSYAVPCLLQLPLSAGNQAYFDWMKEQLEPSEA